MKRMIDFSLQSADMRHQAGLNEKQKQNKTK